MKFKICRAITSVPGVKTFLFQEAAVDSNMTIKNDDRFNKAAGELKARAKENYDMDTDIVLNEDGVARVNEQAITSIAQKQFSTKAMHAVKIGKVGNSDTGFLMQALDRIQELLPGTKVKVLTTREIAEQYGADAGKAKGLLAPDNTIVINIHKYSLDTPFHEFAHLAVRHLKTANPEEYALVVKKSLEHETATEVRRKYPELSEEALGEEIFVSQVGIKYAHEFTKSKKVATGLKGFFRSLMNNLFGIRNATDLTLDDSVNSMIKKYSDKLFGVNSIFHELTHAQVDSIINTAFAEYSPEAMEDQLRYSGHIKKVNGKDVYLDINGRHSRVYYKAKDKAQGKLNYLKHMSDFVNLKFQKGDSVSMEEAMDKLEAMDKGLKHTKDAKHYTLAGANQLWKRTSSFSSQFVSEFDREKAATIQYKNEFIKIKIKAYMNENKDSSLSEVDKISEARSYAEEKYRELSPAELEVETKRILDEYDFKREEGTFVHSMAEDFINLYMELKKKRQEYKDAGKDPRDAGITLKDYTAIADSGKQYEYDEEYNRSVKRFTMRTAKTVDDIINLEAMRPREVRENGVIIKKDIKGLSPLDNSYIRGARKTYLDRLYTTLNKFEEKHNIKNVIYKAEVKLHGGDVIPYAGTIDLLAIDTDTQTAYVIDHKTKQKSDKYRRKWSEKWNKFNLGSAFEDVYNNAENKAAIQTSIYGLMLENLGFKVGAAEVFYTEGVIDTTSYAMRQKQYTDIEVSRKPLENFREELIEAFKDSENLDLSDKSMESRNDIHETFSNVFNNMDVENFSPSPAYVNSLYEAKTKVDYKVTTAQMMFGEQNGEKDGFMLNGTPTAYPDEAISPEDRRKFIADSISNKTKLTDLETDFVALFNEPDKHFRDSWRKVNIANMMKGVSKDTHDLIRLSKKSDFGGNYAGIIMFKDKVTGEHTIVQLMVSDERAVYFGDQRTTVMSRYKSDSGANMTNRSEDKYFKASAINLRMHKIGMVMAKMKSLDPEFSVDYIYATPKLDYIERSNSDNVATPYDMYTLMRSVEKLMSYANEAGDLVGEVKSLYKKGLFRSKHYQADMPKKLLTVIDEFTGHIEVRATIKERLEEQVANPDTFIDPLVHSLNEYLVNDRDMADHTKRHIAKTILHLKGFRPSMITQDINFFEKYVSIPANTSNLYIQKISDQARLNRDRARDMFLDYTYEHSKAIKALTGRTNIRSQRVGAMLDFKNLFRPIDPSKPEDMYRFLPDSSLNNKQKDYKKFFKAKLKEALMLTDPHKKEKIDNYLEQDFIPLVSSSFLDKLMQTEAEADISREVKSRLTLDASAKQDNEVGMYDMSNAFMKEIGNNVLQSSGGRRNKLGINNEGIATKKPTPYEMDLEAVLDRVYAQSVAVKFGRDTLIAAKALGIEITHQKNLMDHETQGLAEITDLIGQVFVRGEIKTGSVEMLAGKVNTLATFLAIAGSARSIALETVTNTLNMAKLWIREDVMAKIFKVESKFTSKHMAKAMGLMFKDNEKADMIMMRFGMKETDPKRLRKFTSEIQKGKLLKTDNFFAAQAAVLSIAQMEVLISIMLKDGSYDAYTVKAGGLEYNEKKDKRFYNADGTQSKDQKMLYDVIKSQLGREGKVDADGKLKMGYTGEDLHEIKNYAVDAFSSMDMDSQGAASASLFGRQMGKFKSWINPRTGKIAAKPIEESLKNRKMIRIYDEDGELISIEPDLTPDEGYAHTIGKILTNAAHDGTNMESLDELGRKKMADAAADATTLLMIYLLYSLVTCSEETKAAGQCWHKTSAAGKILYDALKDSPGDVLVPLVIWETVTGNGAMFPSLAVAQRAVNNIFTTSSFLLQGDLEEAGKEAVKMSSLTKHIYNLVEEARGNQGV